MLVIKFTQTTQTTQTMIPVPRNIQIENKCLDVIFMPEVAYIPAENKYPGGLFDTQGNPIPQAVTRRGKAIHVSRPIDRKIDFNALPLIESDTPYFFLGAVYSHFGHFLLEATARLWPLLSFKQSFTGKYLYCGPSAPTNLFKKSFIESIFGGLALHAEDFVNYRKPCRLKNVFVAQPAFEIRQLGHPVFRYLMQYIGNRLADNLSEISNTNPIPLYLSRCKLNRGGRHILNEIAIEEILREKGVDVWYPETLSLSAQIKELSSRKHIIGPIGSAFHTLLFCPGNKIISGFTPYEGIQSTYFIIDKLCGNRGEYESGSDMGVNIVKSEDYDKTSFKQTYYASEPYLVAERLLHNLN